MGDDHSEDTSDDDAGADGDVTRRSLLAAAAGAGVASTAGCAGISTPADVASAASIRGNVAYFRGPDQLTAESAVFLDARSRERFRREHVYGARRVPVESVTARAERESGLVPDADAIASTLGSVGLTPDRDVVVYGSSVGARVSRVVFALEYLGHEGEITVLNGGYEAWNGRVGVGSRVPVETRYEASPNDDLIVTRDWIADRVGSFNADGPGLIDVRPPEAYLGARNAAKLVDSNARHGHLPGAVDVHWTGNVNGQQLAEPGTLAGLYFESAGVDMDGPTVVYGQGNVNPTNTWLVLRALQAEDVRLYDGGFGEWANVPETLRGRYPVETKTTTVVETTGSVGGDDDGGFSCTG
ncbi:sulfurtransferase [Haloplanus pelagicus]|jgi:thiosulfate/3-mercaptopyruvate sulfurtransferase|uniref:sulfurtransferase n=1 Tax=Haloplanus pelagicus TaxID=2949995 RepID=UPI00203B882D|nr:rhodanese-like domain-containing protein [Haloplanus sp. HW8-1]